MNKVTLDWRWSDRYLPKVFEIVGPRLLTQASIEVDRNNATDLVLLTARDLKIACRIRRPVSNLAYLSQFTIRGHRRSGAKSEMDKIIDGWADWMFYGFAAAGAAPDLAHWYLIDLTAFRAHLIRNLDTLSWGESENSSDGTSFYWFDVNSFPQLPGLLIARSQ